MTNRPGSLAARLSRFGRCGISIDALATEGNVFGSQGGEILVRMVVSEPGKASSVLAEEGAVAVKTDVLLIDSGGKREVLGAIAERLATADVNIESVYLSSGGGKLKGDFAPERRRQSATRPARTIAEIPTRRGNPGCKASAFGANEFWYLET